MIYRKTLAQLQVIIMTPNPSLQWRVIFLALFHSFAMIRSADARAQKFRAKTAAEANKLALEKMSGNSLLQEIQKETAK